MKESDVREFEMDSHSLTHLILKKVRLCERYGVDYDSYIDKGDLRTVIDILDCCIKNKDSKYILRRDYEL